MKRYKLIGIVALFLLACMLLCACQGEQGIQGEQGVQGEAGADGKTPIFRENDGWLEWKYEDENESAWRQIYQLEKPASTDFTFVINEDGDSYTVVGISNFTSTTVEIPAEFNGKPVTKISSVTPLNYSGVKEIIIPNSVTEIEKQAFLNCASLEKINIPDSVKTIGAEAFYMCSSLKEITINVETIEAMTFYHCDSLQKITLGEKTKIIGDQAFARCVNLTEITFNDELTVIGSAAFNDCVRLTDEITIPRSVYKIGSCAFSNTAIAKLSFADPSHWIFHFDGAPSLNSFAQFGKLTLDDAVANVELASSPIGTLYAWQKGVAVGVSGGIEPFATVTGNEMTGYRFAGFDIDLIIEIDEDLDDYIFGFVYIQNFDESFAGIDNGRYDIVISAMEYTTARTEDYSASSTYYSDSESSYVIYGKKSDNELMQQINDALATIMNSDKYSSLKEKHGLN